MSDSIFERTKKCDENFRSLSIALFTNEKEKIKSTSGYALSEAGIALVNGAWEEFRNSMSREEVEAQFSETYRDVPKKEYLMKLNAGLICHEVLHCVGLFHPNTFNPQPVLPYVEMSQKNHIFQDVVTSRASKSPTRETQGLFDLEEVPNIMSYYPPNFSQNHVLGVGMSTLQKQLLHSYLAGNNNYKAVRDSKDFDDYLARIAIASRLKLE